MARTILHVDLDAFFVSAEQARDPSLAGKAVIVGGDPDGRGVVSTASYEARVFGVHSGMPLRTARRLAPDAIFLRGDFALYSRLSRDFHRILADFTPLMESGGLDEAYLDITGCEAIAGTGPEAAARIRTRVRDELALPASVGIATSKLVAKVASDKAKPDGVLVVRAGSEAGFLAPLPLRDLPMLGPATERRLSELGVSAIGQVASLPDETLRALFGEHGIELRRRCLGIDSSPVTAHGEAKSISREGTFAEDVSDRQRLRSVLRGFAESVGADLRRHGRRARTVSLRLRYGDFRTLSRSVTPGRPLSSDDEIFAAGASLLDQALARDRSSIRLIGIGVSNLVADAVQLSLETSPEQRSESLSAAFDKVRTKYGRRILQTGRTAFDRDTGRDDWRHEKSAGLSSQIGHRPPKDKNLT